MESSASAWRSASPFSSADAASNAATSAAEARSPLRALCARSASTSPYARVKGARTRSSSANAFCAAIQLSLSGRPAEAAMARAAGSAAAKAAAALRASVSNDSSLAARAGSTGRESTATSTGSRGSIDSAGRLANEGSPCDEGVSQAARARVERAARSGRIISRCLVARAYSRNCFKGGREGVARFRHYPYVAASLRARSSAG